MCLTGKLYWSLQVTSSFSNWGCILKGCFVRGIFWRANSRLKGVEDFNLEHCMEDGLCPKSDSMGQLLWSGFLKYQFTKSLGPSVIVNRMWTERNEHAPKRECYDLFNICPKEKFWKEKKKKEIKFDNYVVFIFSSLNIFSFKIYCNNTSLATMSPCLFLPLLPLPLQNPLDMSVNNVGLEICLLGTSNSVVTLTIFFLGVNWSVPGRSSTTNHIFYKGLGTTSWSRCRQPLSTKWLANPHGCHSHFSHSCWRSFIIKGKMSGWRWAMHTGGLVC